MKKLAKILVLVLVLAIVVTCLVACGEKTTIDISSDGYWVIDGVKTEHKAIGENGINGIDGVTPTIEISSDGYWVINGSKTDKKAIGENGINGIDGVTPTIEISADGYWVINGNKTEYKAVEEDDNPQGLDFYLQDDGTYAVKVGRAAYLSEIVIPSTYKGKAVTKIPNYAFCASDSNEYYDYNFFSITIPDSITSIRGQLMYSMRAEIIYCEAESKPSGWDDSWNNGCYPVVWDCKNNDVADDGYIYTVIDDIMYSLKDGVATIIKQLGTITSINIPASITYKGNTYAVTSIGDDAFENCASLQSVTFGENSQLESIGSEAFENCTSLTSITIPDSVTSIEYNAFYNCDLLIIYCEAISKPSGWDSDWNYSSCPVVWDCNNNDVAEDGYIYTVIDGIRYGIKDNTATVVRELKNIITANIQSGITYKGNAYAVTSIGESAFYNCTSLTSITIPDSVTSIGDHAFSYCYSLESVTFGENSQLESIGDNAFRNCTSLTSITIPDSVTSIGSNAFYNCTSLESVTFGENSQLESIGSYAFENCASLTSITIPDSVTSIGESAFSGCASLTSITIPDSVASIEYSAFYNCTSLTIYCEAESKPDGWDSNWNALDWDENYCTVVWGYNG